MMINMMLTYYLKVLRIIGQAKLTIGAIFKNNEYKLTSVYIDKLKENELSYDKNK